MSEKGSAIDMLQGRKHCDDYILDARQPMCLRWWLYNHRIPAVDKMLCEQNGVNPKLFADYNGKTVRVTMASRFGDLGISYDMTREMGYEERSIAVCQLTNFRTAP